jgi:hypothetical protein
MPNHMLLDYGLGRNTKTPTVEDGLHVPDVHQRILLASDQLFGRRASDRRTGAHRLDEKATQ